MVIMVLQEEVSCGWCRDVRARSDGIALVFAILQLAPIWATGPARQWDAVVLWADFGMRTDLHVIISGTSKGQSQHGSGEAKHGWNTCR